MQLNFDLGCYLRNAFSVPKKAGHTEMPNINDFQVDLLHIGVLLLPPLVPVVIDKLSTFDPDCPVPCEALLGPLRMNPCIHLVLHAQHIDKRLLQIATRCDFVVLIKGGE